MFGELKGASAQLFYAIGLGSSILITCAVIAFVGREAIKKQKLVEFFGTGIAFVALGVSLFPFIVDDKDKEAKNKEISDLKNRIEVIEKQVAEAKRSAFSEGSQRSYEAGYNLGRNIRPYPYPRQIEPFDPFGSDTNTDKQEKESADIPRKKPIPAPVIDRPAR